MIPQLLILDDQQMYLRSLNRALRQEYSLVTACSVTEAKEKYSPDVRVILSDIRLDESNQDDRQGLNFIKWARDQNVMIPIIAMSAIDDLSLENDAIAAGATKFLRKPIVVSQLKTCLHELTKRGA